MKNAHKITKGHLYIVMAHYPDTTFCDVSKGQILNLRTNQFVSEFLITNESIKDGMYQLKSIDTEYSLIPIERSLHTISMETMVSLMGSTSIDRLALSITIQSILTSHGVKSIVDIYDMGIVSLLSIPGITKHNIDAIKRAILEVYPNMPLPLFNRADLVHTYLTFRGKMAVDH